MNALLDRDFAIQKLRSALNAVDSLLDQEWPYADSHSALQVIHDEFSAGIDSLIDLDVGTSTEILTAQCRDARSKLYRYMGFLGIILRSQNVRNSFEVFHPIKKIGVALLDDTMGLVLGSEWHYTPFVYPHPTDSLSRFVFVGLPASEAQNALLTPIAGHELGHAVWRRTDVRREFTRAITEAIVAELRLRWDVAAEFFSVGPDRIDTDIDAMAVWSKSQAYAIRQAEEVFCDILALRLFGSSFAHAFRYLLAPDSAPRQSSYYPTSLQRARYLARAAEALQYDVSPFSAELFNVPNEQRDVLLAVSDAVTGSLVDRIIDAVDGYCAARSISRVTDAGGREAESHLRLLQPCPEGFHPGDILNGAWYIRHDIDAWDVPGVESSAKVQILNDLVLKSFEVQEWHERNLSAATVNGS